MWGEFCEAYAPSNEDNKKREILNNKIDFLEAVQYMLKGRLCEDFNGRVYKIENRKFYYKNYSGWISCFNYEIPTATEWKLVN